MSTIRIETNIKTVVTQDGARTVLETWVDGTKVDTKEIPATQQIPFAYEPASASIQWHDKMGLHYGNLANFRATADLATVIKIECSGRDLTSLTIGNQLPSLRQCFCSHNWLHGGVDIWNAPGLTHFRANNSEFPRFDFGRNTALQDIEISENLESPTPDISMLTNLNRINAYGVPGWIFNVSKNRKLLRVDFGSNLFTPEEVDKLLADMESFKLSGGHIEVWAAPTAVGLGFAALLRGRGYFVGI